MNLVEPAYGTFTTQELARLAAYRAAVRAGFYTDWDGTTESTDVDTLKRVTPKGAASGETGAYPFTADELERLEQCRAAVAAGYYSEN